jgi:WD40 repeat protein
MAAAWSRDGARLVTAGADHHLRVWLASTGALVADLDGGQVQYLDATFSPDARSLAPPGVVVRRRYGTSTPAAASRSWATR